MRFPVSCPIHIVMIGCGGTGGHIAPHLYRLLYSVFRPSTVILCDGDLVEKRNLIRQNFVFCDLGRNKAEVLAERYSAAFGMECRYVPRYIESEEELRQLLLPERADALVILVGAVDNNRSRRLCNDVFYKAKNLVYIDSGNGLANGQVVCGVRKGGRTVQKPVAGFYPDILDSTDKFPSELSCAEASVSSPQAMTANIIEPELVYAIHHLITDSPLISELLNIQGMRAMDIRNRIPRPPLLYYYTSASEEKDYKAMQNLFVWCRTNHKKFAQEEPLPKIAESVDIVNPNFPPTSIMSREKFERLLTEMETWRRSNHTIR